MGPGMRVSGFFVWRVRWRNVRRGLRAFRGKLVNGLTNKGFEGVTPRTLAVHRAYIRCAQIAGLRLRSVESVEVWLMVLERFGTRP